MQDCAIRKGRVVPFNASFSNQRRMEGGRNSKSCRAANFLDFHFMKTVTDVNIWGMEALAAVWLLHT